MKVLKQLTATATLILFCFLTCNSQQNQNKSKPKPKPDFSGTWVSNISENKDTKSFPEYALSRKTASCLKEIRLKIEHQEPQLKFIYTYVFKDIEKTNEEIYYSDGRKEKNQDYLYECEDEKITFNMTDKPIETNTYWKGNSLITRTEKQFNFQSGSETITEIKLSKDGQTLIINIRIESNSVRPNGRFRRIPLFDSPIIIERKFHRVKETK